MSLIYRVNQSISPVFAILVMGAFAYLFTLSAWFCDDAFITVRCVKQWLSGNGIGFNPNERVMAFTHPAWFLCISALVSLTGDFYETIMLLSLCCSLIGVASLLWVAHKCPHRMMALGCIMLLTFSKAFIDYGTSGLENPLAFGLFGALFLMLKTHKNSHSWIGVLIALLVLTRMDYGLILLPLSLLLVWRAGRMHAVRWLWGGGLLLSWLVFATVYFGSPFPNTFYAKLGSDASASILMQKGANYFYIQSIYDPVTLVLCVGGIAAGLLSGRSIDRSLGLGMLLYGLYIYRIGGDFMQGRFFAVGAFCGVYLLVKCIAKMAYSQAVVLFFGFSSWVVFSAFSTHVSNPWADVGQEYSVKPFARGIADSRGSYFSKYGFYSPTRKYPKMGDFSQNVRLNKAPLVLCNGLGAYALRTGNVRYIIDQCALTDPYLARMPMKSPLNFRIGHMQRAVAADYLRSREKDTSVFSNANFARLYNDIVKITSSELFDPERLRAILRINGGLTSYGLESFNFSKLNDRIESRNLINSQFPGSN